MLLQLHAAIGPQRRKTKHDLKNRPDWPLLSIDPCMSVNLTKFVFDVTAICTSSKWNLIEIKFLLNSNLFLQFPFGCFRMGQIIFLFFTSFRDYWTIFNENLSYSKKKVIHNDLACFTLNLFLLSGINSIPLSALLKFNNIKRLKNFTFHLVKFDDAECQCWKNSQLRRMSHIQSKWNDKNQVKYLFLNQLVVFFCSAYSMTNGSDEGSK